jgi:hypothetical protein
MARSPPEVIRVEKKDGQNDWQFADGRRCARSFSFKPRSRTAGWQTSGVRNWPGVRGEFALTSRVWRTRHGAVHQADDRPVRRILNAPFAL